MLSVLKIEALSFYLLLQIFRFKFCCVAKKEEIYTLSFFRDRCFLVRNLSFLTTWFLGDYAVRFDTTSPYVFNAFHLITLSGFAGSTPIHPSEWRYLLYQVGRDLNKYLGSVFPDVDGLLSRLKALWRFVNEG